MMGSNVFLQRGYMLTSTLRMVRASTHPTHCQKVSAKCPLIVFVLAPWRLSVLSFHLEQDKIAAQATCRTGARRHESRHRETA